MTTFICSVSKLVQRPSEAVANDANLVRDGLGRPSYTGRLMLLAAVMFVAVGRSDDMPSTWPQFRGPGGSGVAYGQKPPVEFGPAKNVKWKVPVPSGLSSPIIAGGKVVVTAFDDGKLFTVAYNRLDGKEAWRQEAAVKQIEPFLKQGGSPAASTPATDGQRIVSYFGSCGLICYDLFGKELWKFEMPTAATFGGVGSGTSPIFANNTVMLVRDESKDSRIIALDAVTGKLKWERKRQSPAAYCTPVVWNTAGEMQVVAAGHGRLIAYDLTSGAEKWSVTGMPAGCCASPFVAEGILFFAGWSPGGPDDDFQMPTFDKLLKDSDTNGDGFLSKEEAQKTLLKDAFDSNDQNNDGKLAREEWDAILKFMLDGKNSAFAVKGGGSGDITNSHILWTKTKGLPYVPTAIAYGGQFMMVKDGGIVTACDAMTGQELYQQRAIAAGSYYASPVAANGHVYFTSLNDGTVTVLKAGADKPEVVAKNPPLEERVAATPAIAGNTIYFRTDKHLYAFAEEK